MNRMSRMATGALAAAVLILLPASPGARAAAPGPIPNCLHVAAATKGVFPQVPSAPVLRPGATFSCPKLDK